MEEEYSDKNRKKAEKDNVRERKEKDTNWSDGDRFKKNEDGETMRKKEDEKQRSDGKELKTSSARERAAHKCMWVAKYGRVQIYNKK